MKGLMFDALRVAGRVIMKYHESRVYSIREKEPKELVIDADIESEQRIISLIKEKFPGHNIMSEEFGNEDNGSDYTWVIDPLDGTHNFIFRVPFFGVSIALAKSDEVIMGGIFFPVSGRLYHAEKNCGAFANGKKINVSDRKQVGESMVLYDNQFHKRQLAMPNYQKVAKEAFTTRILGSAVHDLCTVARGEVEARVFNAPKKHDFAAGALIVEEAGGKVTDFEGNKWGLESKTLLASNGRIHDNLLNLLE